MGSGSSKGSAKVVELYPGNNFGSKHKNVEQNATESQNITDGFDEGKVTSSAKALAYDALETKERTSAVDEPTSSLDSLLASFSEQYPAIAPTFSLTREYYQGLKDALDGNKLLSPPSVGYSNGLFSVYLTYKKPSNRFALTEFVVALGFPKLAYNVIIECRKNYPELTTWDRAKQNGKDNKDEETEQVQQGNDVGQRTAIEQKPSITSEQDMLNIVTEGNDTAQGTAGDTLVQENNENVDEKGEQAVVEKEEEEPISQEEKEKIHALKMSQEIICNLLKAVLNFSNLNDSFCLACNDSGMVPLFVDMIKELKDAIPDQLKNVNSKTQQLSKYTVRGRMLSLAMGVLHNLSKRVPTRKSFADCQAINVLIPLLKAEVMIYSAKSLLVLAYLTDEDNNHLIMADEGPIKFLIRLLKKSLGMVRHKYFGFSSAELAEGLTQIAVNDNNKKTIVQCEAIPVLVTMLQKAKTEDERLNACNTLWTLAFDEENKKQIRSDESAIAELRKLLTSDNSELKRAAAGALWECEGKQRHTEEKQQLTSTEEGVQSHSDTKHVMISYQWDVQKSMIHLKTQLQAQGYKVWMDVDEMGGSTLESMARAVENASVVLVCVSQKYKESPNCRSEAEYTYQLHKDVIPLMMDYKYKPDGWLGIIVGAKFWIDFTERHKLDSNIHVLVRELGVRGKVEEQETQKAETYVDASPNLVDASPDIVDASPHTSIKSWTHDDVRKWLKEVGLEDRLDPKAVKKLDGGMLLRLQDLRKEITRYPEKTTDTSRRHHWFPREMKSAKRLQITCHYPDLSPEFFYSSVEKLISSNLDGADSVFEVLLFTDELEKLRK